MFTPQRVQCGVSDYSRLLIAALREMPDMDAVRVVEAPDTGAWAGGGWQALRRFPGEERRFQALGAQMNANVALAHVQHQYFFFGGVAPYKNHARAFLNAIRVPIVMTVHEIAQAPAADNSPLHRAITLTNRRNFLHPALRALIVHTQEDYNKLLRLGVNREKIHLVVHAVPPAMPMPSAEEAKRSLGLEGRRVITLFGFLAAKKGHSLALSVMPFLPPDVTLLFAGGQHPQDATGYVAQLQARIEAEGLQARVRITGYLPETQIPVVMAATDVGIAPFTQTSGSGSLANLFAYGRAIIASDITPHQEIARRAPGCLELYPVGEPAAFAARLQGVLDDSQRREQLQRAALDYARRHSYLEMARETVKIYQRVGIRH